MKSRQFYYSSEANVGDTVLRSVLLGLLGIYVAAHVLFAPLDFIMLFLLTDKDLQTHLYIFVPLLITKYGLLTELFMSSYKKITNAVMHFMVVTLCTLVFIGLSLYFCRIARESINLLLIAESPYLYDFLGCVVCAAVGIVYTGLMAFRKEFVYYAPLRPKLCLS
eukprot:TRINITY_DN4165_c0_g2_i1.p1 TRINITY_DN4165_c0_g2~~TRINITY_DN4165_c0_g2_i1.p1  ORF type:complete len:165 (-),score=42.26 TRINITY_DN4165_c0_g2_i1:58-552(-)